MRSPLSPAAGDLSHAKYSPLSEKVPISGLTFVSTPPQSLDPRLDPDALMDNSPRKGTLAFADLLGVEFAALIAMARGLGDGPRAGL